MNNTNNTIRVHKNPSEGEIKRIIQQKLEYAHRIHGYEPGSVFQINDSAHREIYGFVKDNLNNKDAVDTILYSAVDVASIAFRTKMQSGEKRPYVIREEDIKSVLEF